MEKTMKNMNGISFSPDSEYIAVWNDHLHYNLLVYRVSGKLVASFCPFKTSLGIKSVDWSFDSVFLAVSSFENVVRILDSRNNWKAVSSDIEFHFLLFLKLFFILFLFFYLFKLFFIFFCFFYIFIFHIYFILFLFYFYFKLFCFFYIFIFILFYFYFIFSVTLRLTKKTKNNLRFLCMDLFQNTINMTKKKLSLFQK